MGKLLHNPFIAPGLLKSPYGWVRQFRNRKLLERAALAVDAFLVSYPKSGRTWLRYLLSCYFAQVAGLDFEPDLRSTFRVHPNFDNDAERGLPVFVGRERGIEIPLIAVSHLLYDAQLFGGRPTIIMVRDPRDVCVSAWFHETRHKHRFSGPIAPFIEDERHGVPAYVRYHNAWACGLEDGRPLVISYEEMSENTAATVCRILQFLDIPVDDAALAHAIERAQFNSMQQTEKRTGIPGHDYDRTDGDSLRVRKGKVGGYADTLDEAEAERILAICRATMVPEALALLRQGGITLD